MEIQDHCKSSLERFGKDYRPFHELLDCYAGRKGKDSKGEFDYTNDIERGIIRKYRHKERLHNKTFTRIIREMYGDEAADALEQHILEDYKDHIIFCNEVPEEGDSRIFWRSLYR